MYGSSSSSSLSPPSGTGSAGVGLVSSVLQRTPLLFNAANLLKYLEITPPHAPPGKNDGLEGGVYDHGLLLESNLANTQKRKQWKGKLT